MWKLLSKQDLFYASTLIFWHAHWKYLGDNNDDIFHVAWLLLSTLLDDNL